MMDALALNDNSYYRLKRALPRLLAIGAILFIMCLWSSGVLSYVGLGGFQSEKMISSAGTGASSLVLSRDGAGAPPIVAMGPLLNTQPATNITFSGGTSARLNGNLTALNGAAAAEVWFRWGYDANCSGPSTAVATLTAPGAHTATITGFDPARTVFFQFVGSTDGTVRGSVSSFAGSGGAFSGYNLLWWGILLAIIGGVVTFVLRQSAFEAIIGGVLAGLVAYVIAQVILQALW